MPYVRSREVPCRHCPTGWVTFFTSFTDPRTGVTHYAKDKGVSTFWKCDNPDCPGKGGQYNLGLAA